jgi:hypothetical protein
MKRIAGFPHCPDARNQPYRLGSARRPNHHLVASPRPRPRWWWWWVRGRRARGRPSGRPQHRDGKHEACGVPGAFELESETHVRVGPTS